MLEAPPREKKLKISAGERGSLSSAYFGVVEVTFENNTPAWIQIDHIDLDSVHRTRTRACSFRGETTSTSGSRRRCNENAIRRANTRNRPGARRDRRDGGERGGRSPRRRRDRRDRGAGRPGGPLREERTDAAEAAGAAERFPPTHLLALPVRVPPGLFAKRWMLLYTAAQPLGGCIDSFILTTKPPDTSTAACC